MTKHESCLTPEAYCDAQTDPRAFLVLEARRIVLWAGQLIDDNEEIGGIGEQLQRAAKLLQLHYGVVWRAYQRRAGPEIFPTILEARNLLLERMATKDRRAPVTRLDDVRNRMPTRFHRWPSKRFVSRRAVG